jgi:hypothetical protein
MDTSRPSFRTDWTRLVPLLVSLSASLVREEQLLLFMVHTDTGGRRRGGRSNADLMQHIARLAGSALKGG